MERPFDPLIGELPYEESDLETHTSSRSLMLASLWSLCMKNEIYNEKCGY